MANPLVSVITPVLNAAQKIEGVIDSVQEQSYPAFEHIVIDGGSDDGSVDVIRLNEEKLAYWISEKDGGIYDAMNKGINVARGEWIYFLGADDRFYDKEVLSSLFRERAIPASASLIMGKVILCDGRYFICRFNSLILFKNTVHHQGVFYRRSVFEGYRYGTPYGKRARRYRISGDYELNLSLYYGNADFVDTDIIIARAGGGISLEGRFLGYLEEMLIRRTCIRFPGKIVFDMFTVLRFLYARAFRRLLID